MKYQVLSGLLLLAAATCAAAESSITLQQPGQNDRGGATATVNFIIRIPHRLGVNAQPDSIAFKSNIGNLLVTDQPDNRINFVSNNDVINSSHHKPGYYTAATP